MVFLSANPQIQTSPFILKHPVQMDDLGYPYFGKPPLQRRCVTPMKSHIWRFSLRPELQAIWDSAHNHWNAPVKWRTNNLLIYSTPPKRNIQFQYGDTWGFFHRVFSLILCIHLHFFTSPHIIMKTRPEKNHGARSELSPVWHPELLHPILPILPLPKP